MIFQEHFLLPIMSKGRGLILLEEEEGMAVSLVGEVVQTAEPEEPEDLSQITVALLRLAVMEEFNRNHRHSHHWLTEFILVAVGVVPPH